MTRRFDIAAIAGRFPDFRTVVAVADRLAIPAERPPELDRIVAEHEQLCRERWAGTELSAIPGRLAQRLPRLRHQEDELPLLGRAARQERARRAPAAARERLRGRL